MPRLSSQMGTGGASGASVVASTRLLDRDISEMSDEELSAAIAILRGARVASPGASRRPASAAAPKVPTGLSDDDSVF